MSQLVIKISLQYTPITWANPEYTTRATDPWIAVTNALSKSANHGPILIDVNNSSKRKGLYDVNTSMKVTIVLRLEGRSCLDQSHTKVAVTICWIYKKMAII